MKDDISSYGWWEYLDEDLRELVRESTLLVKKVENWEEKFHDYAFVVFPAAKAFEGFLKKLFFDLGFIDGNDYYGKRFRVGKALNPSLESHLRSEGVYDKLKEYCKGGDLADVLWDTWKSCRNLIFHWFPNEKNVISFSEAKDRVTLILNSMDKAFEECKIDTKKVEFR